MGSDDLGNKYYERPEAQYGAPQANSCPASYSQVKVLMHMLLCTGRHRWVVYANLDWPDGYEPTQVPAEWHGALCLLRLGAYILQHHLHAWG